MKRNLLLIVFVALFASFSSAQMRPKNSTLWVWAEAVQGGTRVIGYMPGTWGCYCIDAEEYGGYPLLWQCWQNGYIDVFVGTRPPFFFSVYNDATHSGNTIIITHVNRQFIKYVDPNPAAHSRNPYDPGGEYYYEY